MTRTFEDRPAVRERIPLLLGLIGPSGTGKTMSALRLAAGFQRVCGGETFVIDTESRRALHYAEKFKFRHVPFGAPFSPLDYLQVIEHCVKRGARTIVVDSMSHEHEGAGGVLDMHEAEVQRLSGGDERKAERVKLLAWSKPKAQRQRLINTVLQMDANFIFSFRAKDKLRMKKGEEPTQLGFMPIAGDTFIYELVLKCLLLPGADGVPTWHSDNVGERLMIKLPDQFRAMFAKPTQLSEDVGESLAKWAAGTGPTAPADTKDLVRRYEACSDAATWRVLEEARRAAWGALGKDAKAKLKQAADGAAKRVDSAADLATSGPEMTEPPTREPGEDE